MFEKIYRLILLIKSSGCYLLASYFFFFWLRLIYVFKVIVLKKLLVYVEVFTKLPKLVSFLKCEAGLSQIKKLFTSCFKAFLIFLSFYRWGFFALFSIFFYTYFIFFYLHTKRVISILSWYVVGVIFYLFILTFNTILLRYRYGKFTKGTHRIWRKGFLFFWTIELSFFFLYYGYYSTASLNAQDINSTMKQHNFLIQLDRFYFNSLWLCICLLLILVLVLRVNSLKTIQTMCVITAITTILFFCMYIELYQVYHTLMHFHETNTRGIFTSKFIPAVVDASNNDKKFIDDTFYKSKENKAIIYPAIWCNEIFDVGDTAVKIYNKYSYLYMFSLLRFWHYLYFFIGWVYLVVRFFSSRRISYSLLGFNFQNLLIISLLNFMSFAQYLQIFFDSFSERPPFDNFLYVGDSVVELVQQLASAYATIFYDFLTRFRNWYTLSNLILSEQLYFSLITKFYLFSGSNDYPVKLNGISYWYEGL